MLKSLLTLLSITSLAFVVSCGGSAKTILLNEFIPGTNVEINNPNADPFLDSTVNDVVISVTSVASPTDVFDNAGKIVIAAGSFLDENADGIPDVLPFPPTCDVTFAPNCGFPQSSADFSVNGIPLNARYTLTMRFRDSSGNDVYSGTTDAFNNISDGPSSITITLNKL